MDFLGKGKVVAMIKRRMIVLSGLALTGLVCISCGTPATGPANAEVAKGAHAGGSPLADITSAVCVVRPTAGNQTSGVVTFQQADGKVTIVADLKGLKPNAEHAIHIHKFGDARSADGKSAGGHYNPEGHPHGSPTVPDAEHHAGDLGNLQADENGEAHYTLTVDDITIGGSKNPILGRSIIIHGGQDDYKSQPSGAAGPRVGIGVIGIANPDVH